MHEEGNSDLSVYKRRGRHIRLAIYVIAAVILLPAVSIYRIETYLDLYTGIARRQVIFGIIPLPCQYSEPEHAIWALQNMRDPAKRKWVFGSRSSRNLLTGRGIEADGIAINVVYAIHASALDPAEKLRYLTEWHRDVDGLPETADLQTQLYDPWRKKLEALPQKP